MDSLASYVDNIFTDTFDEAEIVGELYGIKFIFAKADEDPVRATVLTLTSSSRAQAEARRTRMWADDNFRLLLTTWFSLHKMKEDNPLAWKPIASKVVTLAVVPF